MESLSIGPELVGRTVQNAARPEWGEGRVLRVEPTSVSGRQAHRITVQFRTVGMRTLVAPPARLIGPQTEPTRESGWLSALGRSTLDDRLRALPARVTDVLGSPDARIAVWAALFEFSEDSNLLLRWARDQTGVADPLSHWTRDELHEAFRDFRRERDAGFRAAAANLRRSSGGDALEQFISAQSESVRREMREALGRAL